MSPLDTSIVKTSISGSLFTPEQLADIQYHVASGTTHVYDLIREDDVAKEKCTSRPPIGRKVDELCSRRTIHVHSSMDDSNSKFAIFGQSSELCCMFFGSRIGVESEFRTKDSGPSGYNLHGRLGQSYGKFQKRVGSDDLQEVWDNA